MEGIQTIQALKAVQSSLPAQTTIPSDELVMLYAADGTPIAKIARDDLVKAVASVMASNSQNTFSNLLGVQANGTPMGIGASDLASVLGVPLGLEKFSANALQPQEESSEFAGSCMLIVDIENGAAVCIYVLSYWNSTLIQFAGSSDYSQRIEIVNNAGNTFRIKNISSDNVKLKFRRISR